MQIRNFTNFWNIDRKIYSIYDLQLPAPVSLRAIGIFVGTAIPYWGVLILAGLGLSLETLIVWLGLPIIAALIGNRPIFEGKSLIDYISSRIKFIFESKRYKGIEPATEKYGEKIELTEYFYSRQ